MILFCSNDVIHNGCNFSVKNIAPSTAAHKIHKQASYFCDEASNVVCLDFMERCNGSTLGAKSNHGLAG